MQSSRNDEVGFLVPQYNQEAEPQVRRSHAEHRNERMQNRGGVEREEEVGY